MERERRVGHQINGFTEERIEGRPRRLMKEAEVSLVFNSEGFPSLLL